MSRTIHADVLASLQNQGHFLAALYELELDAETLRMWSGIGSFDYGGNTYAGVGDFLRVSRVDETTELRAAGVTVEMSGIPADLVSTALAEPLVDRFARVYLVHLDGQGAMIGEPVALFVGRADMPGLNDDGGTSAAFSLRIESRLIDMSRPRASRLTDEEQQRRFPGDLGLEHVAALQDYEIQWGG